MAIELADWALDERGNAIVGASVSVVRTDGAAFTYDGVSAASHSTTTDGAGYWAFTTGGGLPDLTAGVYYDVTLTNGSQVRKRKGGIMLMVAGLNLAQALTVGAGLLWDFTAALLTLPQSAGASPTTSGSIALDTTSKEVKVGDGAATKTLVDTDTAQTMSSKTLGDPALGLPGVIAGFVPYVGTATQTLPAVSGNTGKARFYKAFGGSLIVNTTASVVELIGPGATSAASTFTLQNGESATFYNNGAYWVGA